MQIEFRHKHLYYVNDDDGNFVSQIKFNCKGNWVFLTDYVTHAFTAQELIQIGNFMLELKNPDIE